MKAKIKYEAKVKEIIDTYKINLAKLMRKGLGSEVMSLLHDSGPMSAREKNMYEIAKKAQNATSHEEIEIHRVNFVFSLLTKQEREVIVNDFLLIKQSLWWGERFSRSSFYRLRKRACKKFVEFYGIEKK